VTFMENGFVVEDGPPSTIFGNPRSERTKSFLRALSDR
jgi:ABC-type histidine transport system ATPase subunit